MKIRVLAAVVLLASSGCQDQSNHARAKAEAMALKTAIEAYRIKEGSFPVASNPKVAAALQGKVVKRIYFEIPSKMLDAAGDIIDPWGTLYDFSIQNGEMRIMSLGKNKVMDSSPTADDIVVFTHTKTEQSAAANP